MPNFKRDRPTIGILPGWSALAGKIPDRYLASVLRGIQSAARIRECNLLLAWGLGRVNDPSGLYTAWPVASADSDFVPVGPWNTDGLIVFAPLRHAARSLYIQELCEQGYPVLFIATGEREPMVSVDNEMGIRQAMTHLVNHGHRHIAFIAGDPDDRGDSDYRLQAYHSAVVNYGLDTNPCLVAPGWHTFSGGYEAVHEIIKSGATFTALLASDDNSAIGAMQALRDAGLQIPRDIAVIGFDDQPDAVAQVPPLTSVHVPLTEIGQQALVLMFDHLIGQHNLESIRIPTRLVSRQSCGCMPSIVSSAAEGKSRSPSLFPSWSEVPISDLSIVKQQIADEMFAQLPASSRFPGGERIHRLCASLVESFHTSLSENTSTHFQSMLMEFLHDLELTDDNIGPCQEIISALRREMTLLPLSWDDIQTRRLAEDLLHQARAAISESTQRQDHRHQYQREIADQSLSELTARLSAILDERQAVEILEAHVADVGIHHVRVALFEADKKDDPVAWSIMLNSNLDVMSQRFASREFPPPNLYPADELLNVALVPLVFQDELLGYVAFDADNLGPCTIIARQLAATFKASRLHAQIVELSLTDSLTGVYNRRYFDIFLSNEVDRSRRFGRDLAIIILDIDYFKNYNDTFGHPAGDKALQFVARCLKKGRRQADVVARLGGEEFALILPETEVGGVLEVAEKIRTAMIDSSFLGQPLTLSMGISILHGNDVTTDILVQQADLALYEAKRMGRNRVSVFEDKE